MIEFHFQTHTLGCVICPKIMLNWCVYWIEYPCGYSILQIIFFDFDCATFVLIYFKIEGPIQGIYNHREVRVFPINN
jgi:hypothetical protein